MVLSYFPRDLDKSTIFRSLNYKVKTDLPKEYPKLSQVFTVTSDYLRTLENGIFCRFKRQD